MPQYEASDFMKWLEGILAREEGRTYGNLMPMSTKDNADPQWAVPNMLRDFLLGTARTAEGVGSMGASPVSQEDLMHTLGPGLAPAAASRAGTSTLGIFAGLPSFANPQSAARDNVKYLPQIEAAIRQAEAAAQSNPGAPYNAHGLWQDTWMNDLESGVFKGADDKFKIAIPTRDVQFTPGRELDQQSYDLSHKYGDPITSLIDPKAKIFDLVPELRSIIMGDPIPKYSDFVGGFTPGKGVPGTPYGTMRLKLEGRDPEEILNTVVHELGHGTQAKTGLQGGASPSWFLPKNFRDTQQEWSKAKSSIHDMLNNTAENNAEYLKLLNKPGQIFPMNASRYAYGIEEAVARPGGYLAKDYEAALQWLQQNDPELFNALVSNDSRWKAMGQAEHAADADYYRTLGEAEARAAANYRTLTLQQRFANPPQSYIDAELNGAKPLLQIERLPDLPKFAEGGAAMPATREYTPMEGYNPAEQMKDLEAPIVDTSHFGGYKSAEIRRAQQVLRYFKANPPMNEAEYNALLDATTKLRVYEKHDYPVVQHWPGEAFAEKEGGQDGFKSGGHVMKNSLQGVIKGYPTGGAVVDPYGLGWQTAPHAWAPRGQVGGNNPNPGTGGTGNPGGGGGQTGNNQGNHQDGGMLSPGNRWEQRVSELRARRQAWQARMAAITPAQQAQMQAWWGTRPQFAEGGQVADMPWLQTPLTTSQGWQQPQANTGQGGRTRGMWDWMRNGTNPGVPVTPGHPSPVNAQTGLPVTASDPGATQTPGDQGTYTPSAGMGQGTGVAQPGGNPLGNNTVQDVMNMHNALPVPTGEPFSIGKELGGLIPKSTHDWLSNVPYAGPMLGLMSNPNPTGRDKAGAAVAMFGNVAPGLTAITKAVDKLMAMPNQYFQPMATYTGEGRNAATVPADMAYRIGASQNQMQNIFSQTRAEQNKGGAGSDPWAFGKGMYEDTLFDVAKDAISPDLTNEEFNSAGRGINSEYWDALATIGSPMPNMPGGGPMMWTNAAGERSPMTQQQWAQHQYGTPAMAGANRDELGAFNRAQNTANFSRASGISEDDLAAMSQGLSPAQQAQQAQVAANYAANPTPGQEALDALGMTAGGYDGGDNGQTGGTSGSNSDSYTNDWGGVSNAGGYWKDGGAIPPGAENAAGGELVSGFINTASPGKADQHEITVAADSHVIPAYALSHFGEGNSLNGVSRLEAMLKEAGGTPTQGGSPVKIKISGGEYVVEPWRVHAIGRGDMDRGHSVINTWVKARKGGVKNAA